MRLKEAPCVTKEELRRIIKDELRFEARDDPKIMREYISQFGNVNDMRDSGIGPAYLIHDHLAKDLAPKFIGNSEATETMLQARANKKSPGPAAYGDISAKLDLVRKIDPGIKAGWHSHAESVESTLCSATSEEPGPLDYVRKDDFGKPSGTAQPGTKFTSRGTTDLDIKIRTAKALPSPGQYNVQNDRLIRKFHAPSAFISNTNSESQLETIIRTSKATPGPNAYNLLRPMSAIVSGGKFNTSKSKSELDWVILRAQETPAGNHYFRRSNGVPPYKLPPEPQNFLSPFQKLQ